MNESLGLCSFHSKVTNVLLLLRCIHQVTGELSARVCVRVADAPFCGLVFIKLHISGPVTRRVCMWNEDQEQIGGANLRVIRGQMTAAAQKNDKKPRRPSSVVIASSEWSNYTRVATVFATLGDPFSLSLSTTQVRHGEGKWMRFYPSKYLCSGQEKERLKYHWNSIESLNCKKAKREGELKAVEVDTVEQKSQWYARDRKYQSPWLEVILPKYHRSKTVSSSLSFLFAFSILFALLLLLSSYKRNQLQDRSNKTKRSHLSTLRTFAWTKCLCLCYSWWFIQAELLVTLSRNAKNNCDRAQLLSLREMRDSRGFPEWISSEAK